MIKYEKYQLKNGLTVIHHYDANTPMVVVNVLYKVGAKNENPAKTGFAHLFEHLMFGGSINVPNFDTPLQLAGGDNNAFTNNDITNYYETLPAANIETALWVESDRMLQLDFSEQSLEVQRKVVCEEFKQRYLNQPYGDVWLKLRPLAYKTHPYQWATIGKELSHIENASLKDVKEFFYKHYGPDNAILSIAGNISFDETVRLAEKWFGGIENRNITKTNMPIEPLQNEERFETVKADVPQKAIYKAYHMCDRLHVDFHATDFMSDILSGGKSGRLLNKLVKEQKLFSDINAYISGDIDAGLFVVEGRLNDNITFEQAEEGISIELIKLQQETVTDTELQKVKNKAESIFVFGQLNLMNKAMNLAFAENIGHIDWVNTELDLYNNVQKEHIQKVAKQVLVPTNCSTLYYEPK
ncbi:MAG: pitrilysin family protein [Bacteroidota bacterium]|nr:pitrilysin family protein [Bacteroidota bacterium]